MSNWLLDSKGEQHLTVQQDQVVCNDELNGSPINALYQGISLTSPGRYHVEFQCENCDDLSVGLTTKNAFGPGYSLRGFLYNGNLSDGSRLLLGNFGKNLSKSSRISFLVDLNENQLRIYLVLDDLPLGLAFHVKANYTEAFHPVIHFYGSGTVRVLNKAIDDFDQLIERQEEQSKDLSGNWKLDKYLQNETEVALQCNYKMSCQWLEANKIQLCLRVINSVSVIATIDTDNSKVINIENMFHTLMAGPPEKMQDEHELTSVLSSIKSYQVSNDYKTLILISDEGKLHFNRFKQQFQPYDRDPITELL